MLRRTVLVTSVVTVLLFFVFAPVARASYAVGWYGGIASGNGLSCGRNTVILEADETLHGYAVCLVLDTYHNLQPELIVFNHNNFALAVIGENLLRADGVVTGASVRSSRVIPSLYRHSLVGYAYSCPFTTLQARGRTARNGVNNMWLNSPVWTCV
jgi:hypothetical protein